MPSFVTGARAVLAAIALCVAASSNAVDVPRANPSTKVAAMLSYQTLGIGAERLVEIINTKTSADEREAWLARLQRPVSTRLMIEGERLSPEIRAKLEPNHPDEILHRYIVLEYVSTLQADSAWAALARDQGFTNVYRGETATFSVVPADPYYAWSAVLSPRDYQWSLADPMGMQSAWNSVRGTAYLAHLDNGIQMTPVTGGMHPDLVQAIRRFRYNVNGTTDVDEHPELVWENAAGHGTHTAGIMAAATSQTSVPAGYPNPPTQGVAATCWYCSLLIAKVSRIGYGGAISIDTTDTPGAINWAIASGAQVINMSFGGDNPSPNCPSNPTHAYCAALDSAAAKAVVIAAAAGNSNAYNCPAPCAAGYGIGTNLDFPASNSNTIAVAASQWYTTPGHPTRINLWTEEYPQTGFYGTSGGPGMETRGVLAPGRDILSTFYTSQNWNQLLKCGVANPFMVNGNYIAPGTIRGPAYGICTGTSMATPHISGIVGLMRTVNPLLDAIDIRQKLLSTGGMAGNPNQLRGYGQPNANTAVNLVLATTNRLTPLFSFYNSLAQNHFYTVVPQMGRAAAAGTLIPRGAGPSTYTPYGTGITGYAHFPDPATIGYVNPRAEVWLFTTHTNPFSNTELMPLYRLSWKCGDGGGPTCGSNPNHVSHVYTTSIAEAIAFGTVFYQFDGIEGYVHPTSLPQPTGTTPLMRAYNYGRDDYALFPQSRQAAMAADGYTADLTTLGYVYLNATGNRPTH